jgi:hypothetical protein
MKNLLIVAFLLTALVMTTSAALAQTREAQVANDLAVTDFPTSIAIARCQYTPADNACAGANDSAQVETGASPDGTIAQSPRRVPGPPLRPRRPPMAHPRGEGYPGMRMEPGSARRAAIGALIGFGLGAAMGAKANTDQHPGVGVKAALAFGTIGGLLGAGIGAGMPTFHARNPYQRGPWHDQDDGDQVASRSEPAVSTQETVRSTRAAGGVSR